MGAATPIEIPILDEVDIIRDGVRRRPVTARCAVISNDPLTNRPLKRSPSHIALVIESLADAQPKPAGGLVSVPLQAGLGRTTLRLIAIGTVALIVAVIVLLPSAPNAVAGLSIRELASIEAIAFLSGVMSGLSGFGFSAIGATTLLILQPSLQVPLFQTLSTGNQLLSAGQLREDMPKSWRDVWAGPGPCMVGGVVGVPIGIWLLAHLPATQLMTAFGTLLVLYAVYSMFKPASFKLRGYDGTVAGGVVGFIGGVVGGFTAFPGAAIVVWTGSALYHHVPNLLSGTGCMAAPILFECPFLVAVGSDIPGGGARNPQRSGHLQTDVGPEL
jgi:uncharacterized membrane protein YfcA